MEAPLNPSDGMRAKNSPEEYCYHDMVTADYQAAH